MLRAGSVVLGGVAVALLAGCLLTTDLDGLAGSASDGGTGSEATTSDGALDEDGDGATDAATDAPVEAGTGFCATHPGHTVCTDFDESTTLPTDWTVRYDDGLISWSSVRALSVPGALFATLPRRVTNQSHAELTRQLGSGFRHVVLELDMYLETPSYQNNDVNAALLEINWFSNTLNSGLVLSIGNGYMTVGTPGSSSVQINKSFPYAQWVHVRLDLDPAGSLVGEIGDIPVSQTYAAVVPGANPQTLVTLGVDGFNAPAPAYNAYYDNVLIDTP